MAASHTPKIFSHITPWDGMRTERKTVLRSNGTCDKSVLTAYMPPRSVERAAAQRLAIWSVVADCNPALFPHYPSRWIPPTTTFWPSTRLPRSSPER